MSALTGFEDICERLTLGVLSLSANVRFCWTVESVKDGIFGQVGWNQYFN